VRTHCGGSPPQARSDSLTADGATVHAASARHAGRQSTQSWAKFLPNHAGAVLACDFFLVVTATFQRLYLIVVLDIATGRVVHWNVAQHPTAGWTVQQSRNSLQLDAAHQSLVHNRDPIFAPAVDAAPANPWPPRERRRSASGCESIGRRGRGLRRRGDRRSDRLAPGVHHACRRP
jgi:hypothetical protein